MKKNKEGERIMSRQLQELLTSWDKPEELPISFGYGGQPMKGIPAEWDPQVTVRNIDCNITETTVVGISPEGLEIRVECKRYRDFPAVEYVAFLTNRGTEDSPLIEKVRMVGAIPGENAVLYHGNGETKTGEGYEWWQTPLTDKIFTLQPRDGTSCFGAFPYMRVMLEGCGVSLACGWSGFWTWDFAQTEAGVAFSMGQARCNMVIHPGETMRVPSLVMLAYEGDQYAAINSWRRWYFAHIMPKQNFKMLEPKCCMHLFQAGGKPEFTGATEENQLAAINSYIKADIHPDVWWIDAGWYPCDYVWPKTGNWYPNPENFPNGLRPISDKCHENGMEFLLWFEPERIQEGTDFANRHPQWLLRAVRSGEPNPNLLVNLGIPECCDFVIDMLDGYIKEYKIDIYRQDFNLRLDRGSPMECWIEAEVEDRIGAVENLHIQGYYRMWDTLLARNPGLLIDSCASGGRRNDIETMRRSVPFHYTDVGYGNHPIKLKQHRQMFEWIPYFRAHNNNWCAPDGSYDKVSRPADRYSYYVAMTPALTDVTDPFADEEAMAQARRMQPIWRKAAKLTLGTDYYPLTQCRKSSDDFYAAQFLDPDKQEGFLNMVNGSTATEQDFTVRLKGLRAELTYVLYSAEQETSWECTGAELMAGITVHMPKRTADVWFIERK